MRLHSLSSADQSKMAKWARSDYLIKAEQAGVATQVAEQAFEQARKVQEAGLPSVLSLKHLAKQTGCSYQSLRTLAERLIRSPYRTFRIRKRAGGYRQICVAKPDLARVQKWIDARILSFLPKHPSAMAYSKGASIVECALEHAGCKWLIKCDVQQFFESISEIQVYRVFAELGYQPLVAFQMARICTRVVSSRKRYRLKRWQATDRNYVILQAGRIGHLPQGAATSPKLSNLVLFNFDLKVQQLAKDSGLTYTRYADDLTFSAFKDFSRERASTFIGLVYNEMRAIGLRPHPTKTRVVPPRARKVVLGLCVNDTCPRLTREFKSELKTNIHYICRYSLKRQADHKEFDSIIGFRNHIEGKLRFAYQVEPEFVGKMEAKLANCSDWQTKDDGNC